MDNRSTHAHNLKGPTMTTPTTSLVDDAMMSQFREQGYFVLESVLDQTEIELLRGGAEFAIELADAEMDAAGVDRLGINARGKRYFSTMVYRNRPELREFVFGSTMADICGRVLGPDAYLFWEQYVIKATDPDSHFAWHQDAGYVHEDAPAYLTCWIALDDVDEQNGSVYLLPYSRSGIRTYIKHERSDTGDEVCYFGADPGIAVTAPAGSIVCFSSLVIHRSGPNLTDRLRRVYLLQYSDRIITKRNSQEPWGSFEPLRPF